MFHMRSMAVRGSIAVLALCGLMAGEAQARIFIGFGLPLPLFVPPLIVPPPAYYPPYYGPPPAYAPPDNNFSYVPPSAQPRNLAPPRYDEPSQSYPPPGGYTPSEGYGPPGGYTPSGGYGPPRGYSPSMGAAPTSGAQSCRAGAYVCPLVEDTPPGGTCACPGHDGKRIRGQAS